MKLEAKSPFSASINRYLFAGLATCAFLVGVVGALAATISISGAVIAHGLLAVSSNVKKIQHPTGGVVSEIDVKEGSKVRAGDLLVKLDPTVTRANLAIVANSLDEYWAQLARLEAERDGMQSIRMPAAFTGRENDPTVQRLMKDQQTVFELRANARSGLKSQLRERITQLGQEISGQEEQQSAKRREMELIKKELDAVQSLWDQKLVSVQRLAALQREAAQLDGEYGARTAAIAQSKGKVAEIELQIIQIDEDLRSEVAKEISDLQAKVSEAAERKTAAEDQLKRVEIRSPQEGVVHELAVHTIGGVIAPGETVLQIVPTEDDLAVEARILPQDIDQVHQGQQAIIRLSAFSQQTTPVLDGKLEQLAVDLTIDKQTGAAFYQARVEIPRKELAKLDHLQLTAGMPAEVYFETGDRTMLSYIVKPLKDQLDRAFRED
ncbi:MULTISPECIES: HlyD family type I secretion periplasmic adaptor subunit [Mesorhizobium]|uniref:Membrane fusion protein (MFP) family protein n=1 Tax=Mesorhizobium denitrificans TaxID=2294114 RepID=A0A371XCJ8_9HYPH|nr:MULTISPECIES: HlyD family type I secretion periplasmic adaptor subunit [Mesorhizobium]RFC66754.1 HlyD family type I secretion periplasmic adaptor subunit [Mesorhizobium denitrificans]